MHQTRRSPPHTPLSAPPRKVGRPKAKIFVEAMASSAPLPISESRNAVDSAMKGSQQPSSSGLRSSATRSEAASQGRRSVRFHDPRLTTSDLAPSRKLSSNGSAKMNKNTVVISQNTHRIQRRSLSDLKIAALVGDHASNATNTQHVANVDEVLHNAVNRFRLSSSYRNPKIPLLPFLSRNLMAAAAARDARATYLPIIIDIEPVAYEITPSGKSFRGPLTLRKLQKLAEDTSSRYKREWSRLIRQTVTFFKRRGQPNYDVLKKPIEDVYADVVSLCKGRHGGRMLLGSERCMKNNLKIVVDMVSRTEADVEGLPPMWKWSV